MTSTFESERRTADLGPPFSASPTLASPPPESRLDVASGAVARRDALLLGVLRRVLLHLRAHELAVGLHPVADHLPLGAVPLLELHQPGAFVVEAGDLERRHEAGGAELLQTLRVDVQVLDAPAHLLAGARLALPELLPREADRLDGDDARHDAARVVDRAEARLVLELSLALVVDVLLDVLHHREARARRVEAGGDVALRRRAGRDHVLLGAGPPHADDLVARVADLRRRLERGRVHHAPAPEDHPVGLELAHLQPLRLLLVARVRHGDRG